MANKRPNTYFITFNPKANTPYPQTYPQTSYFLNHQNKKSSLKAASLTN
ncbi:hypothetical protein [Vibrio gallaecicus]|nr:hypothetical protein [Vibrio gallaecicus]MDN3614908.1 hypothetical protein [Vibrio gallaecicus]MDN3617815.1 hypothetical protein [Vibrio gallaecicus]MDN3617821.1 hypothetical protein [Vibrio gallaecicus]